MESEVDLGGATSDLRWAIPPSCTPDTAVSSTPVSTPAKLPMDGDKDIMDGDKHIEAEVVEQNVTTTASTSELSNPIHQQILNSSSPIQIMLTTTTPKANETDGDSASGTLGTTGNQSSSAPENRSRISATERHTPEKTYFTCESPEISPRKFLLMYEDMRARYNELKKNCDEQMLEHENKVIADNEATMKNMCDEDEQSRSLCYEAKKKCQRGSRIQRVQDFWMRKYQCRSDQM